MRDLGKNRQNHTAILPKLKKKIDLQSNHYNYARKFSKYMLDIVKITKTNFSSEKIKIIFILS